MAGLVLEECDVKVGAMEAQEVSVLWSGAVRVLEHVVLVVHTAVAFAWVAVLVAVTERLVEAAVCILVFEASFVVFVALLISFFLPSFSVFPTSSVPLVFFLPLSTSLFLVSSVLSISFFLVLLSLSLAFFAPLDRQTAEWHIAG
jgi:hypothetical protein